MNRKEYLKHQDILGVAKHICFPQWDVGTKSVSTDETLAGIYRERCQNTPLHHLYPKGTTYVGVPANDHHFTTAYHYDYVIPVILDLFGMKFDRSDYELTPYLLRYPTSEHPDTLYDFSYLKPKFETSYHLFDYLAQKGKDMNTLFREYGDYDCVYDKNYGDTEYHRFLYCTHSVAKITNNNLPYGKDLIVSCDSQMVLAIPILINYFRSITMLDNRYGNDIRSVWLDEHYDCALFAHFSMENANEWRFNCKMFWNFGIDVYF